MPYANNQGIRIHYEVEGEGPPLILHHGTSGSCEDWRAMGYSDVLERHYRLILVDARGHGASDKPYEPAAYDLPLRVTDVTTVLDDLNMRRAHYLGYSMGGWIGFGLAKYAPERLHTLILGGAHTYAESLQPMREIMEQGSDVFIARVEALWGSYLTPAIHAQLVANDVQALLALTQDRAAINEVLPNMTMPCLLFVGETDPRFPQVHQCTTHIPNATFFSLPACDHTAALARSDLVLPHVRTFLAKVRT